jgi:hypothetical protein
MSITCCINVLLKDLLAGCSRQYQICLFFVGAVLELTCFLLCDIEANSAPQCRFVLIQNIGVKTMQKQNKKGTLCNENVTPPTLVETNGHKGEGEHPATRVSERDLLAEFKQKMALLGKHEFVFLWQKAALILEYEEKFRVRTSDDAVYRKKLRKLESIYKDEFDLPPTTAQRYKRVFRFFAPYVFSEDTGTPTLNTLAKIQMSKLDLLVGLNGINPFSWHFTDDGCILRLITMTSVT